MSVTDFIGRGWRFPVRVGPDGRLRTSGGPDRVRDAVWIVLRTCAGERVMRPRFGASTDDFVFRPNSPATRAALTEAVRQALALHEPRVELDEVRADPVEGEPSQVLVTVGYRLKATNEAFNLVYPFYLREGTA